MTGYVYAAAEQGAGTNRVSIDVKDTDIRQVLDAFSKQTGLSIVIGNDVKGAVTVRLIDVPWDRALEAVLKPYGYGAERSGEIITILPLNQITDLNQTQPLSSRVFVLTYRDAGDILPVIESQLSPRGRVKAVEETGQKGWDFGAFGTTGAGSGRTTVGGSAGRFRPAGAGGFQQGLSADRRPAGAMPRGVPKDHGGARRV
ncbi:MAG: secretin and TonB N-terminal domain-containing protein [Candidatus Omnitrophica bacterium]|nr:secretin and TonB N-terminal domain-containing protein [Candidatus Omnitrophota bacterium]